MASLIGSPLGVTFVLDNKTELKPTIYCRYIDDIFIITNTVDNLLKLKQ